MFLDGGLQNPEPITPTIQDSFNVNYLVLLIDGKEHNIFLDI
jgi:hypothetical protein